MWDEVPKADWSPLSPVPDCQETWLACGTENGLAEGLMDHIWTSNASKLREMSKHSNSDRPLAKSGFNYWLVEVAELLSRGLCVGKFGLQDHQLVEHAKDEIALAVSRPVEIAEVEPLAMFGEWEGVS